MDYNSDQAAFIHSRATDIAVIAGPGSGKTRALVGRIVERISTGQVKPHEICVLTFTNAAAREIGDRIRGVIPDFRAGYMGTIHGFCFRLLQRFGFLLGYRREGIGIVSEEIRFEQMRQIADRMAIKISDKKLRSNEESRELDLIRRDLQHELKRNNLVDYDHILTDGLALLRMEEVRAVVGFVDLYVDEAQDSADIDWEVFASIPRKNFAVIGDPDQSIYAFRGGNPKQLQHCWSALNHQREDGIDSSLALKFTLNYRSAPIICRSADRLITNNAERIAKPTIAANEQATGTVRVVDFATEKHEEQFILQYVEDARLAGKSLALLSRNNTLAGNVISFLEDAGVSAEYADTRMPDGWSKGIAFLSMLVNPSNTVTAMAWLRAEHGDRKAQQIQNDAAIGGCSVADLIRDKYGDPDLQGALLWLAEYVPYNTLEIFKERAASLEMEEPTVADLLSDLWEHDHVDKHIGHVYVGTIHSAKGREWDEVLLLGMEEGSFPNLRCNIEEERRLAYVGATRARHTLTLSCCRARKMQWGETLTRKPSPFIEELA